MNETKKPRSPKPKDEPASLFQDKETEAAFGKWWEANAKRLESFEKNPEKTKTLLFALAEFWYERVNKAWQDTIDLLSKQGELIGKLQAELPEAVKRGRLAATLAHWPAIQAERERLVTLATKARPKAIEKRKQNAAENNAALDKAILDLFENHPRARSWTNNDIVDWLASRHPVYKPSTILQRVKKKAAEIRKKDRQDRQLPNG